MIKLETIAFPFNKLKILQKKNCTCLKTSKTHFDYKQRNIP